LKKPEKERNFINKIYRRFKRRKIRIRRKEIDKVEFS